MKVYTALAMATLAIAGFLIKETLYPKEEKYSERLARIAAYINSQDLAWKAQEHMRWQDITLAQAKRLQGVLEREPTPDFPIVDHTKNGVNITIDDNFDARDYWPNCSSIRVIRDQSACGSCWAFGAAEAMSDRLCIHSGQKDQTLLSTQDILECCHSCGAGCDGGTLQGAWEFYKFKGVVSGGLYYKLDNTSCKPYAFPPCAHHVNSTIYPPCPDDDYPSPSCYQACQPFSEEPIYLFSKRYGHSVYAVRGEANMKTELYLRGPIEGAFTVYEDFLTYKTGVYIHTTGQALGGHAIRILGYGTEHGVDYWLCANSWNESWGDNGFFKIKRGSNHCGIEGANYAGMPRTK